MSHSYSIHISVAPNEEDIVDKLLTCQSSTFGYRTFFNKIDKTEILANGSEAKIYNRHGNLVLQTELKPWCNS